MPDKSGNIRIQILIAIVAGLVFIPFLGGVHLFDWDEINFAESAREMITSGDYLTVQINFVPFWEKPPLFIWMQVFSMKIFGINEFAARIPNAICGIITLLILFNAGRRLYDSRFGITWVFLYAGSMLPFIYFKSGIIDPWFNLFIFLSIYQIFLYFNDDVKRLNHAMLSAFFLGLAIITKGPVAILVFLITFLIYLLVRKFKVQARIKDILAFTIVITLTGGIWFILQILQGNFSIIADFIEYQIRLFQTKDAGHGGFLLYHFVVLFFGVFPASILALPTFFPSRFRPVSNNGFYIWMLILFWVVIILFTIVKTKIVHYSSLCYFPLTFMATLAVYQAEIFFRGKWLQIITVLITVLGILIAVITATVTFTDRFKHLIINRIDDPFAIGNLAAHGGWKGFEFLAPLILIAGIVVFLLFRKKNTDFAVKALASLTALFIFASLLLIVPKIEAYSQRAAVEFFESVSDEDAYLTTVGYKSYAHLFYGRAKMHNHFGASDKEWLLKGDIDKPVYFSSKINRKEKILTEYPDVRFLYEKNGFIFFKRNP